MVHRGRSFARRGFAFTIAAALLLGGAWRALGRAARHPRGPIVIAIGAAGPLKTPPIGPPVPFE